MMLWITGSTQSGKTTRLVNAFAAWVETQFGKGARHRRPQALVPGTPAALIVAANDENRRHLGEGLVSAVEGRYPAIAKTPLGFVAEEVVLFWPLLFQRLNLKAQFPLRLRPETEQELATRLWRDAWELTPIGYASARSAIANDNIRYRLVRATLDLMQLAGASETPIEGIGDWLCQCAERNRLCEGLVGEGWETAMLPASVLKEDNTPLWQHLGNLLVQWRQWCLTRGLLTYGLMYELYWRFLLDDPLYQHHLQRRYQAIFADDLDDYPAILRSVFERLLDGGAQGTFTYNPDGQIRLGLGADPQYLAGLARRCQVETLSPPPETHSFSPRNLTTTAINLALNPVYLDWPPATGKANRLPQVIRTIQTTSRATLLRQSAIAIVRAIKAGEVAPEEVAIIAPGLDEIARYTLIEILSRQGIPIRPLNEQRALISSPLVRGLLALLAFVYPNLGRVLDKDEVAQMLVVLGRGKKGGAIDPVRAGLLADYCYVPDPEQPELLPIEAFPRWDRLGKQAAIAYQQLREWLNQTRTSVQQQVLPNVVALLDRAIEEFIGTEELAYDQLAAVRELTETAQHYWEVERRLQQNQPFGRLRSAHWQSQSPYVAIAEFITLLRRGTITANPYPLHPAGHAAKAVTLATIFQYRSARLSHRWHFWLDASSPLWLKGGAANLFGASLFLKQNPPGILPSDPEISEDERRLQRILKDLLARAQERVYLCHSDLAVNGNEQNGPLLSLVHAAVPVEVA